MTPEFTQHGARYRFDGMPAQVETRILRRLAPLLAQAVPLVLRRASKPGVHVEVRRDLDVPKIAATVLGGIGTLADADLDFIERACLGALSREQDGAWLPVWPGGGQAPAFADINGASLQCLMGHALGHMVKGWIDTAGDAVPSEFRALASALH